MSSGGGLSQMRIGVRGGHTIRTWEVERGVRSVIARRQLLDVL